MGARYNLMSYGHSLLTLHEKTSGSCLLCFFGVQYKEENRIRTVKSELNTKSPSEPAKTIIVQQLACGGDRNFGYILADGPGGSAYIVDPSPDPNPVIERLERDQYLLKGIINTHGHGDHSAGINEVLDYARVPVLGHLSNPRADMPVSDGEECLLGQIPMRFIHTPGHTADSICILFGGSHLFTGDTLFVGKVGGTHKPEMALAQFESLQCLMELGDHILVWPGHHYGSSPHSSLGSERLNNPFVKRLYDFSAFLRLKENWVQYKLEHGIS